jgi:hypothetical protein
MLVAAFTALIAWFGWWKPRAVFSHAYDQPQASGAGFVGDLKRLVRHRAIYPAVLLMFMFQFEFVHKTSGVCRLLAIVVRLISAR